MTDWNGRKVAVIGLDPSGLAVCELLARLGAKASAFSAETPPSQKVTGALRDRGAVLGNEKDLEQAEAAVHSAAVSRNSPLAERLLARGIPVLSDLELASRHFYCLNAAITGTNGKTTTAELLAAMLAQSQRKTIRAGASGQPVCSITEQTRDLDFVVLDVHSFQLESIDHFRPAVAVLLNLKPDHMDRYEKLSSYARTLGRLFQNQQVFDWAVIQSEALAHLRELGIPVPSKLITFSARSRRADIYLDRGLLISSISNWSGPLFNMDQCALRGPHQAENVMAALAAGHVMRIPLDEMAAAVKNFQPSPHRQEVVAEANGVQFINNSKAMNVDAAGQSIEAIPPGAGGAPNVWLIAGGKDKGLQYHDLGPLLAQRVKGAFLIGEAQEKLRAAWGLFTPCTASGSLLEAVQKAAENAAAGDFVLLSPACSSLDMFQSYQDRGEAFREAVHRVVNPAAAAAARAELKTRFPTNDNNASKSIS